MLHFFCENIICSGIFAGFRKEYYGISVITQKSHVITYVFQMIRHLLNFYHFSAFRQGDDIYIHHGFFRKQDYIIPTARIQALRIVQPPIARLTGRCEARIICVGIGDNGEELAQLSLCWKKEEVYEFLQVLLPEFSISSINSMRRPPKHTGKLCACACLFQIFSGCLPGHSLAVCADGSLYDKKGQRFPCRTYCSEFELKTVSPG